MGLLLILVHNDDHSIFSVNSRVGSATARQILSKGNKTVLKFIFKNAYHTTQVRFVVSCGGSGKVPHLKSSVGGSLTLPYCILKIA